MMFRPTQRPLERSTRASARRRVLASATALLVAVGGLTLGTDAASAYRGNSTITNDGTVTTITGGLTVTAAVANGPDGTIRTTFMGTAPARPGGEFSPDSVMGAYGKFRFETTPSTITRITPQHVGTVTLTFSSPVTNPRIHMYRGMGGIGSNANMDVAATALTVVDGQPEVPTLTKRAGFDGWSVTDTAVAPATLPVGYENASFCNRRSSMPELSPPACGSLELTGTVQSVTLRVDTLRGSIGAGNNNSLDTVTVLDFTVDEDLAGGNTELPATYGPASHVNSGLSIGAGLTNDAPLVRSGSTPQVQSTDENDAFTEAPSLYTARANTINVPVNGLLPGHTATTSVWVDANMNGVFDDNEMFSGAAAGNGIHTITIPSSAIRQSGDTWIRIRTSEIPATTASSFADSGEVEDWAVTISTEAPAAPVVTAPADDSLLNTAKPTFTGTGQQAGQAIEVRDASGTVACSTTVQADLSWSCTPASALPQGEATYSVFELDENSVASDPGTDVTITVDTIAPAAPAAAPTNGTIVRGTAEPLSTVTITNAANEPIGSGLVDAEGNFAITTTKAPAHGEVLSVTATDTAGNTSPKGTVTVNTTVPGTPTVDASNGEVLKGTGTAGETITVTLPDDSTLTTVVDGSGNWSITVPDNKPLAHNDVVTVISTNPEGTPSLPATVTIDSDAPDAPTVKPTNGSVITGTAEAGSTIVIRDGDTVLGTVIADTNGNYSKTFDPALVHGLEVSVTATDAAGNTSTPTTATVNASPVAAPVISPTNGQTVAGTGTPGTTITLTLPTGNPLTATVAGDGTWSIQVPAAQRPNHNEVITATAANVEGTVSAPATQVVDRVAPTAPIVDRSNGAVITGGPVATTDEIIILDGSGDPIEGELIRNPDGTFVFTPDTALTEDDTVTVSLRDPAGNESEATDVVIDTTAPQSLDVHPSNGSTIRGETEPFATVTIRNDKNEIIATVDADENGDFVAPFNPALAHGTTVTVTAADRVGNATAPVSVTVNSTVPTTPAINPTNGSTVSGIGDAGATVTVTLPNDTTLTAVVKDDGTWSVDVPEADRPKNGETVRATAENKEGTASQEATRTVDTVAPTAPVVFPTNGSTVSGTAEPGATIIIRLEDGLIIGVGTADETGAYSIDFEDPLEDGTEILVSARDAALNESPATPATVNGKAVDAPILHPSNGNTVAGTGTPGHGILVTLPNGDTVATTVDTNGNWVIPVAPRLADGDVVTATATNPEGTVSEPGTVTVDTIAPAAPTVEISNGLSVTGGIIELGDEVTVVDSSGKPVAGIVEIDDDGKFVFTPTTPLKDGDNVFVVVTDLSGNATEPVAVDLVTTKPTAPSIGVSDGAHITGGTIGDRETIEFLDGSGNPIAGDLTIEEDGTFVFVPAKPLTDDDTVTALITGPSGLESAPAEVEIVSTKPVTPHVDLSNGQLITGGPIGDRETVEFLDGAGNPIEGDLKVDTDGKFEFVPTNPLTEKDSVTVVVTGPSGLESAPVEVQIDSIAPDAPVVAPTNGSVVRGTAEPGSTVTIRDAKGNLLGTVTADTNGTFALPFSPAIADKTKLVITATDATGNTSPEATATVDASAVEAPYVAPSQGDVLTGTGTPCDIITVTLPDGTVITTVVSDNGTWFIAVAPDYALVDGDAVKVTATNPAGTVSEPTIVVIDQTAPEQPAVDQSTGEIITGGPIPPGDTVTIVDGDGNTIDGELVIDKDGTFTFVPAKPLTPGDDVFVIVTDAAGNASDPLKVDIVEQAKEHGGNGTGDGSGAGSGAGNGSNGSQQTNFAGLAVTGDTTSLPLAATGLLILLAGAAMLALRKRRDA
ncbi:Ig-like domain-containing protein [Lysinibacter cavernae]|uniref:LPXTG-motif cell wall-anchored protein n=1 Tax=Lysinibacter cavernae TaxID=1640652 RepID=A0A7X5R349_9MICO|nr:Ig-like domain-containing protein [Lysinibacter cavernae]NIH54527.1 LPXTG-motif cell wall-anchored protein [Lysinibacter cavernae]